MNMFKHTEESKAKESIRYINQSFVGECKITGAEMKMFGKTELLSINIQTREGAIANFVSIQFRDDKGEINEKGLRVIQDIVEITGVSFDGTNPGVLIGKVVDMAIKVRPKKAGKGKGYPQLFVNTVFNEEGFTVAEKANNKEATTREFWIDVMKDDEPVIFKKNTPSADDGIGEAFGSVGSHVIDEDDDEGFPF